MTILEITCIDSGHAYPRMGVPYRCPTCGGLYDYSGPFHFDSIQVDQSLPGIWRYRHMFNLPSDVEPVSLGEGNTPLIWAKVFGRRVAFKCEFLNPSGSFKDRGSAILAAFLKWHGVTDAVEDSSGNAGASFAAYAARAGIKARIYIPESASGPKLKQIEAYGAELMPIPGSRSDVAMAALKEADRGTVYASHAYLPFNLPGYATAAVEIVEQLGEMPGVVVVPAGQGGLLLGLVRGFEALRVANIWVETPKIIGVQAGACAPLWASFMAGDKDPGIITENPTIAEGVRVVSPLRRKAVLREVVASQGRISVADENEILQGRDALAGLGFYVEPTSAIVWPVLEKFLDSYPDPVVVILTGSGMKYG